MLNFLGYLSVPKIGTSFINCYIPSYMPQCLLISHLTELLQLWLHASSFSSVLSVYDVHGKADKNVAGPQVRCIVVLGLVLKRNRHDKTKSQFPIALTSYTKEKFLELLRKIDFPDYTICTSPNKSYQDFIFKSIEMIHLLYPNKKLKMKANSKPCTD